jgi:hypothetical protein
MKIRNLILVLSTLALPLQAADVGTAYLNLPIAVESGQTKLVGVFLARPVLFKGLVNAAVTSGATNFTVYSNVSSNNVLSSYVAATESAGTGAGSELAPLSDDHYLIEFTSGPYSGLTMQVASFGNNVVNIKGALPDLAKDTTFTLRRDHTISSLLADAGVSTGSNPSNTDVVSVFSSSGTVYRYINTTSGWRLDSARKATDLNRAHVRVSLGTGFGFKPVSTKTIYLSGEYRGARSVMYVGTGGSIVANPYPVAVTLRNSGLADHLGAKDEALTDADALRFLESGRYVGYHHDGTQFVKSIGSSSADNKVLGVGDAFYLLPQVGERIAFNPQYITK